MPKNPTSNENRTVWLIARQMTGKGDSQSDQMSVVVAATKQAFTIAEVCLVTGFGRSSIYKALTTGALKAVKRGRRTAIPAEELESWLASLPPAKFNKPISQKATSSPQELPGSPCLHTRKK